MRTADITFWILTEECNCSTGSFRRLNSLNIRLYTDIPRRHLKLIPLPHKVDNAIKCYTEFRVYYGTWNYFTLYCSLFHMQHLAWCLKMHVAKFKTLLLKFANDRLSLCWFAMSSPVLGLVAADCSTWWLWHWFLKSVWILPLPSTTDFSTAWDTAGSISPTAEQLSKLESVFSNSSHSSKCVWVCFILIIYVYLFVCVTCVAVPSEVLSEDGEVPSSIEPSLLFVVWYFKALIISTTFRTSSPEVLPSQELTPLVCKK